MPAKDGGGGDMYVQLQDHVLQVQNPIVQQYVLLCLALKALEPDGVYASSCIPCCIDGP